MNPATEPVCRFSNNRRYRYTLWRETGEQGESYVQFIGLNPSTADETVNDPTVKRCMGFAHDWGFRWMVMTNVFAYRATDPREMKAQSNPWGTCGEGDHGNLYWLQQCAAGADLVVAVWGVHGSYLGGDVSVRGALKDVSLRCFGKTKDGHPKHPLYLRRDSQLIDYP